MPQKPKAPLPPIEIQGSIGSNISRIRKENGITQEELAENIGITQTLVSKYEKGKLQISSEMLVRFAQALRTSADSILGLNEVYDDKGVSLKISRRMKRIEDLPDSEQRALLKTIDIYLRGSE